MKIKEGKHDHNLTKLLKVCLFAFTMLLPLFAVMGTTLYTIFNKNAKDSYYGETINQETIEETQISNAKRNTKYSLSTSDIERPFDAGLGTSFYAENIYLNNVYKEGYNKISFSRESSGSYRYIISITGDGLSTIYANFGDSNYNLTFIFNSLDRNEIVIPITYIEYNKYSYLDNAFYYALDEVWKNDAFNWVNNGLGSIAIANMLTVFGIARNTFISNILIYWLSITAIYVVIDIVIGAFTLLTHLFNKKAE